jgi:hypothetical protein
VEVVAALLIRGLQHLVEVQEEEGTETQVVESLLLEVQIWALAEVALDGFQAIRLQGEMVEVA